MTTPVRITVDLGSRSYPVWIGTGLLAQLGEIVREHGLKQTDAFVLTNADVGGRYWEPVRLALENAGFSNVVRHDIPTTEDGKNWEQLEKTCARMLAEFPGTGSVPLVFLLGGGVIGDLGGFAAGIFRRGVPFVQVPTTLLAAVDSSVGGKVAVNFGGVKNILGIFNQPRLVVCDLALLHSLLEIAAGRELRSGTSEVIKYGAVCSRTLFEQLERGGLERLLALEDDVVTDIVAQCVALKAHVVAQDEFDRKGIRNVLNFGHTIGHAIELSAANPLADRQVAPTHGEAIAMGMMAAMRLARKLGMADEPFETRLRGLIRRAGLPAGFADFRAQIPTPVPDHPDLVERIFAAMRLDKKFREGKNVFVLPTGVGAWEQRENVDWTLVREAVNSILA